MARILGLDYGKRRIGVALSDELHLTAQPFATWEGLTWSAAADETRELILRQEVKKIVLGLPLHMKGDKGPMADEVERFARYLRNRLDIPVELWDERLSSVQSRKALHIMGVKSGKDKKRIDRIAAVFLLQSYLDCQREKNRESGKREDC